MSYLYYYYSPSRVISSMVMAINKRSPLQLKPPSYASPTTHVYFTAGNARIPVRWSHTKHATKYDLAKFQSELPHLPVPPLAQSLKKYVDKMKPFSTHEEHRHTSSVVDEFMKSGGVGERLQNVLQDRFNKEENWLERWWIEYAYLRCRESVMIGVSPALVFDEKFCFQETVGLSQSCRAAIVVSRALKYDELIRHNQLPPDYMGSEGLCQYPASFLFNSCRIPHHKCDTFERFGGESNRDDDYIVVAYLGQFFTVATHHNNGEMLTVGQLRVQFERIMEAASDPTYAQPLVGLLTAQHRDIWCEQYQAMKMVSIDNVDSFHKIHTAKFIISLDSSEFPDKSSQLLGALTGSGSKKDTKNRFWDKQLHFIVSSDSGIAAIMEHSAFDAMPFTKLSTYLVQDLHKDEETFASSAEALAGGVNMDGLSKPCHLTWQLPTEMVDKDCIEVAAKYADNLINHLDLRGYAFSSFGKTAIKRFGVSPDAFVQLAMQVSYARIHGAVAPTYETAHTRVFLHGRTETIYSCSVESTAFVRAFLGWAGDEGYGTEGEVPRADNNTLRELFRLATEAHTTLTKECMHGQGFGRHLFGLRLAAMENEKEIPSLFADPIYARGKTFKLSTSQVIGPFHCVFGPVVSDGYGVCYNIRENDIVFNVTAMNSHTKTMKMIDTIEQVLQEFNLIHSASKMDVG